MNPGLEGHGREQELTTLCGQEALFLILQSALKRGAKTVRGKFVEGELVKNRFVAGEVARDVRYDVHAGTPA